MVLLALLLACSGNDPVDGTPPTDGTEPSGDTAVTDSVPSTGIGASRAALEADGFIVGDGALVFSTLEGCCDPGANCWGNNPSTPYGFYALPPAPRQPPREDTLLAPFGPVPEGLSRDYLMRQDEAIVWLGTMPPRARYFGLVTNLGLRPGWPVQIFGSTGAATNHLVIEAARGEPAWGQPLAVVTSGNAGVEATVIDALVRAGWDRTHIVTDRMAPVVNLGLDPREHDSFFNILRVAVFDDPVAAAAWRENPGVVWRLTPSELQPEDPQPMPDLPQRGSGSDESAWEEARDALEAAVVARFGGTYASEVRSIEPYWPETLECITSGLSCTGDIRDRNAGISPYFILPTEPDHLVAFGVNHERTGKASYSSVSVQTIDNQRGIEAVDSVRMVGSARPYLDHPLVDDLYVVVFARDCSPFDGVCVTVPWDCPGGPATELLKITARSYLEPATGAAPLPEEMLEDRVMLVFPGRTGDTGTRDTGTSDTGPSTSSTP